MLELLLMIGKAFLIFVGVGFVMFVSLCWVIIIACEIDLWLQKRKNR